MNNMLQRLPTIMAFILAGTFAGFTPAIAADSESTAAMAAVRVWRSMQNIQKLIMASAKKRANSNAVNT